MCIVIFIHALFSKDSEQYFESPLLPYTDSALSIKV